MNTNGLIGVIGIISLLAGLFFLISPTSGIDGVISIHKLTIGETLSIVGAVFIAAQWYARE